MFHCLPHPGFLRLCLWRDLSCHRFQVESQPRLRVQRMGWILRRCKLIAPLTSTEQYRFPPAETRALTLLLSTERSVICRERTVVFTMFNSLGNPYLRKPPPSMFRAADLLPVRSSVPSGEWVFLRAWLKKNKSQVPFTSCNLQSTWKPGLAQTVRDPE